MNTSTPRSECVNMPLIDFVDYFEDLADEADKIKQDIEKGKGSG